MERPRPSDGGVISQRAQAAILAPATPASSFFRRFPEVSIRCIVLIDGEHYPPVIASALGALERSGRAIQAAVLLGGTEKLPVGGLDAQLGVPVRSGPEVRAVLVETIAEQRPELVIDLSDEPVLDYRLRHELAAICLKLGVAYEGADFRFDPPPRPPTCAQPSVAVISTGKRTGKTAVTGFAARTFSAAGRRPVIVAMGRGGPPDPELIRGDQISLEPADLIALADAGRHAASDHIEDAVLARVPTVGCRRCGGGLAGAVSDSNFEAGVALANELPADLLLLEGSGAAIPPVHADATVLVVPAHVPLEYLAGYMGPYRLLLSDLVVVTMAEEPFGSPSQISSITSCARDASTSAGRGDRAGEIAVIPTVFRPTPTRSVEGTTALVATTAPEAAGAAIRQHLEGIGCNVLDVFHSLSDRDRLTAELDASEKGADTLICEIKASGIDVGARWARERGLDVVFMDNQPVALGGADLPATLEAVADAAASRFGG